MRNFGVDLHVSQLVHSQRFRPKLPGPEAGLGLGPEPFPALGFQVPGLHRHEEIGGALAIGEDDQCLAGQEGKERLTLAR